MLRAVPLFRFSAYFLLGLVTDGCLEIPTLLRISTLLVLLGSYGMILCCRPGISENTILIKSLILSGIIFLSGACLNATRSSFRKNINDPPAGMQCMLLKERKNATKRTTSFMASSYGWDGRSWQKEAKVFAYIDSNLLVKEGSLVATWVKPQRIKETSVAGVFDFSRLATQQDIYHTIYLNKENGIVITRGSDTKSAGLLDVWRNEILELIRHHFHDPRDAGLAEALLIGYRNDMDAELTKAYLDTGVVHVIAISGMHLGLIFGLINWLVIRLFGKKGSRWAGLIFSLPILWGFAIFTGCSASVMRSVIMFSFLIAANTIKRKNVGMNALFGSAFILVIHDPDIIVDIGFQLSYAAVLSIMLFNKPIESWIYTRNPLLTLSWKLIAMTLSAQVLTSALVILYFHRFPTLFLFTNLVAVPLSSLLLLLEICLLIVNQSETMSSITVHAIEKVMNWMNGYIHAMANIPFGMIEEINISILTAIAATLLLAVLIFTFTRPSQLLWRMTILAIVLFSIANLSFYCINARKKQTIILNIKAAAVVIHQHGHRATIMVPTLWMQRKSNLVFLKAVCIENNIHKIRWKSIPEMPMLISSKEDFVLLHALPEPPAAELKKWVKKGEWVVIDGSMKMWKIKQLQKAAQGLHLRFHSLRDEGPISIACHLDSHNR